MKDELYYLYKEDPEIKDYVDRYCIKHNKNIFEAFRDVMIEEAINQIGRASCRERVLRAV